MLVLSGTLDRLHLGDLLEWLHLTKATGRLKLSSPSVTRSFDMLRGMVGFASSSRASERMASWLLRKGLASRGALLRALAVSQTRGEAFTEVAERDAGVTRVTMIEAGRSLATALASRVMREDRVGFVHALATMEQHPESVPVNALVPVGAVPAVIVVAVEVIWNEAPTPWVP